MQEIIKKIIHSETTIRHDGKFLHPVFGANFKISKGGEKYVCKGIEVSVSELMRRIELDLYASQGVTQVKRLIMHDMTQQVEMMTRMFAVGIERIFNENPDNFLPEYKFGVDLVLAISFSNGEAVIETFIGHKHDKKLKDCLWDLISVVNECSQWVLHWVGQIIMNGRKTMQENTVPAQIGRPKKSKVVLH